MAKNGYRVIDSDLHLMEPPDLFEKYIDPSFLEKAPKPTASGAGHYARWTLEGSPIPPWAHDDHVWKVNEPMDRRAQEVMSEGWATGFDAATSLRAMDKEGIDVAVMFRTTASMFVSKDSLDARLSLEICKAFNDWVAEYCSSDPARMKPTSIVPQHDPELAAQEARRSVEKLGSVGVVMLPMPVAGRHPHDPEFDVLWAEAERLGTPICFHGTSGGRFSRLCRRTVRRPPGLPVHSPLNGLPHRTYDDHVQHDYGRGDGAVSQAEGGFPGGKLLLAPLVAVPLGRPVGEVWSG